MLFTFRDGVMGLSGFMAVFSFICALLFALAIKLNWGRPAYMGKTTDEEARRNSWWLVIILLVFAILSFSLASWLYVTK